MSLERIRWACCILATVMASVSFAAEPSKDSLKLVKENLSSGKAVLLDVRELDEWTTGHLTAARHLPLSRIEEGLSPDQLVKVAPQNKIIYLHCALGSRSLDAAEALKNTKRDLRPLKQGYNDLVKAGFQKAPKAK